MFKLTPVKKIDPKTDLGIKKIQTSNVIKPKNIVGYDIGKSLTHHMFLVSQTGGGKTNVISNFIPKIIDKDTQIHLFCHTANSDPLYINMQRKYGDRMIIYDSIEHLNPLIQGFRDAHKEELEKKKEMEAALEEAKQNPDDPDNDLFIEECEEYLKVKKPKKNKKVAPKHILLFDDISRELLGNEFFNEALKESRHYGCKCIISSQSGLDIDPKARANVKICMLFPNIPQQKLKQIHNSLSINIPYETFYQLYQDATKDRFNFLTVYIPENEYRKNFDFVYNINGHI